ncbi:MAG: ABC transporter substrate-binding protein [Balneolales bacterium]|nr:ABC transporter substrate-binding protein [Balneolales bacterium]
MMSPRYLISTILTVLVVLVGCSQTETIVIDSEAIRVTPATESPSRQTTASNIRIRLGETEAISSLDPLFANTNSAKRVVGLIYQGLAQLDSDGEIIPGLASSWEVDSDSLVYTFHINPEASFQDSPRFVDGRGRAVTAQDVKASFTRMTNASVPPTAVSMFSPMIQGMDVYNREQRELFSRADRSVSDIHGIQIDDNRTIRFILTSKHPEFLELLATP